MSFNTFQKIPVRSILNYVPSTNHLVTSISEHQMVILGTATISTYIRDTNFECEYLVIRGFKHDILLGSDFLYQNSASLNFNNFTIW